MARLGSILCECGSWYWPKQAWIHKDCVATNKESATNAASNGATNSSERCGPGSGQDVEAVGPDLGVVPSSPAVDEEIVVGGVAPSRDPDKTANRRTRDRYNEYQRGYMQRRRAKLKGVVL